MRLQIASPRPVPLLFVVWKGSNKVGEIEEGIPQPWSKTDISMKGPSAETRKRISLLSEEASRLFLRRLFSTCRIFTKSHATAGRSGFISRRRFEQAEEFLTEAKKIGNPVLKLFRFRMEDISVIKRRKLIKQNF